MVSNMHKCTRSIIIKEAVVKLHTGPIPVRLHKIYPLVPDTRFRGCHDKDTSCVLELLGVEPHMAMNLFDGSPNKRCPVTLTLTYQMCIFFVELLEVSLPIKSRHTHFLVPSNG